MLSTLTSPLSVLVKSAEEVEEWSAPVLGMDNGGVTKHVSGWVVSKIKKR